MYIAFVKCIINTLRYQSLITGTRADRGHRSLLITLTSSYYLLVATDLSIIIYELVYYTPVYYA